MEASTVNLLKDIYYSDEYIHLFIKENEELFDFQYKEGEHIFINKSIKRPITKIKNQQVQGQYFDLESAYGYGGYYTNTDNEEFLTNAFKEYEKKCISENIIAEFIRFHPFNSFPIKHASFFDFNFNDRNTVIVDLTQDLLASYKAKVRNTIKRASEKVTFQESTDIETFFKLYTNTMKKNNASDFYFFDLNFFNKLIELEGVKLYEVLHDNETIAMAFFMFGEQLGHYHLSANSDLSYQLNSNYVILNESFHLAQQNGKTQFILGGGTTSSEDDSLLRFKKKFSNKTLPFFISGKIFNAKIYKQYNELWMSQSQEDIKYFLKYRL